MAQSPPPRPTQWSPPPPSAASAQPPASSDSLAPPAKRPRLSPNPQAGSPTTFSPTSSYSGSPYTNAPSYRNFQLPPNAFQPRQGQANGVVSPQSGVPLQPQQPQQPSSMPPPQRPVERQGSQAQLQQPNIKQEDEKEKYMDINDLSDLVTSSGIDLRREEELMQSSFHSRLPGSQPSQQSTTPTTSFDLASRNSFGTISDRGALNQAPVQDPEEEVEKKHKAAARAFNEKHQHTLANPFLQANAVRRRIERIANDNGVKIPMEGLFDKIGVKQEEKPGTVTGQSMTTSKDGVVSAKAPSILNKGAPLEPVLSLLALAAGDRCRTLVEDSYAVTRGRQLTTDGIVPPEWADLVRKPAGVEPQPAKAVPESITNSTWDQPHINGDAAQAQAMDTVSFLPQYRSINQALTAMVKRDRAAEEARLKRRQERKAKKLSGGVNGIASEGATPTPEGGSAPGTPGPNKPEIKLTKKEQERARKAEVLSDTQQTRNANTTMQAQLGGKKYSWLSGGSKKAAGAAPISRPGAGLGGVSTPRGPDTTDPRAHLPSASRDRRFGVWREDGPGGKNVQLRDWVSVLELDGKEKKTLHYAMIKLGREKDKPAAANAAR